MRKWNSQLKYTSQPPEEVEESFGPNATLSNPFYIGGYTVIYYDIKGKHEISSNPLRINLI